MSAGIDSNFVQHGCQPVSTVPPGRSPPASEARRPSQAMRPACEGAGGRVRREVRW